MSDFTSRLKGVSNSEHATGALYFFLIGLALSDILPTPADYFVFKKQRNLRDEYFKNEITPVQYWEQSAIAYYLYNFIFWVLVGIIIVSFGSSFNNKAKILIAIIGIGAVSVILYNNIKKDEIAQSSQQELQIPKQ